MLLKLNEVLSLLIIPQSILPHPFCGHISGYHTSICGKGTSRSYVHSPVLINWYLISLLRGSTGPPKIGTFDKQMPRQQCVASWCQQNMLHLLYVMHSPCTAQLVLDSPTTTMYYVVLLDLQKLERLIISNAPNNVLYNGCQQNMPHSSILGMLSIPQIRTVIFGWGILCLYILLLALSLWVSLYTGCG